MAEFQLGKPQTELGEETEKDGTVVLIQTYVPKLEAIANTLQETTTALLDAITTATATELGGDPNTMIENFRKEGEEEYKEYMTFKEKIAK